MGYVIVGIIVAILIAIVGYFVMRMLKGNIKLELPGTSFQPGETIRGSFVVTAKKNIEGNRLFVALIANEITKKRHDGETRTETEEIYRNENQIEGAREYPAGEVTTHEFELVAPSDSGEPSGTMGKALKMGLEMFSNRSTQIKWYVEVRLDAKGIDLYTSKQVYIK